MQKRDRSPGGMVSLLGLWVVLLVLGSEGWSQTPSPPTSESTVIPTAASAAPPVSNTVERLTERVRAMEELNKKLSERLEQMSKEQDGQFRQLFERYDQLWEQQTNAKENGENGLSSPSVNPTTISQPAENYEPGSPRSPVPGYLDLDIASPYRFPLRGSFGPGFMLQSDNERFKLQIHYESQVEGRVWGQSGENAAHNGVYLPRQRIFFSGNITKPLEYEFAINRGLNNINLLNAFLNLHFDDRFEIRMGRFFTPIPYDQYAISNYWLLTPERSLFTTNVGLNRQFGLMAWGYLFDKRLDYAAGVFNGSRNSFENLNNAMDFVGYVNARPFQKSETWRFIRFLNMGTSVAIGRQDEPPVPVVFRIGAGSPDANIPGPATVPFLRLHPDVIERGDRLLGSVHMAYFCGGLSLIGEWQYGFGTYALGGQPGSAQVPFSGFYLAGGYFLTGESVERRTRVTPRRPFVPLNDTDERGPGAWEAVARISQLRVGKNIFTSGFADPNLWSNEAVTTELGMNWYWNDYMKIYMFWLRGNFADPVRLGPDRFQKTADMFWMRCQLYF